MTSSEGPRIPIHPRAEVEPKASRRRRKPWLALLAVLVTASTAAALTWTYARDDDSAGGGATALVRADVPNARVAGSGWSAQLHGRSAAGSRLSLSTDVAFDPAAEQALEDLRLRAGEPVEITLKGGDLPSGGATLTRTLENPLPEGSDAALAYFDEEHRAWTVVPTEVSASRRVLRAKVRHFSLWTDIQYGANWVLDTRVDAPKCNGSPPAWVQDDGVGFVDDRNAPLRWCVGTDPRDPDVLVVKVAVNRSYGMGVRPLVEPQWTSDSLLGGGPEGFVTGLLTRAGGGLGLLGKAYAGHVPVMGGMEVHFGFTEQQVRSMSQPVLVRASLDLKYALVGATYNVLQEVAGEGKLGRTAAAVAALAAVAQCESDLIRTGTARDWMALGKAAIDCLTENSEAVTNLTALGLAKALPKSDSRKLGRISGKVGGKLWQVWAAGAVFKVGTWAADRKLLVNARELHVFPKIVRRRPAPSPLDAFVGTWSGPVEQTPPAHVDYGVEIELRRPGNKLVGEVVYPELDCGGSLRYLRSESSGTIVLQERINYGNCVQDCTVEIGPPSASGEASFEEICDGPSTVTGTVSKQSDSPASGGNCGGITFTPNTEDGIYDITADGVDCEVARRVAREARHQGIDDGTYRSDGFTCRGELIEEGLTRVNWRCVAQDALVTFTRA